MWEATALPTEPQPLPWTNSFNYYQPNFCRRYVRFRQDRKGGVVVAEVVAENVVKVVRQPFVQLVVKSAHVIVGDRVS